jgi:tetratricopeptide (TPR) repeat protein
MKRVALVLSLIFAVSLAFSQKSAIQSAYNYHRQGKLAKAKEAIDKAVVNEKTMADAKGWFYRGNIYLDIANSPDEATKALDPDPLAVALESYNKCKEFDIKENYVGDIPMRIRAIGEGYYNLGVLNYNDQKFSESAQSFYKAYKVNLYANNVDTTALYNAAVAADLGENDELSVKYYTELVHLDYEKPEIYTSLGDTYIGMGDTVAGMAMIAKGRTAYPDDFNLLISETNIYLAQNNTEQAMKNLEMAIEMDKTNPTIYFAVGTSYDQLGMFEKAEESYLQAVALNPDYFEASYNLGALYVNKAAIILEKANDLPLDAIDEYDAEKAKADDLLKKSVPHLEKALELEPEDTNTLVSLKEIYTRLGMMDKLKDINARLGQE